MTRHGNHLGHMSGRQSQHTQHILVVDDDPDIRQILQDRLESYGYLVDTAADGPTALQKLNRLTPHCVFLDLLMPGMDGTEVLRRIKAWDRSIKVIIVTAAVATEMASATISKAAHAYLPKPFDSPQLKYIVEQWLECPPASESML